MKLVIDTQFGKEFELNIPEREANSYVIDWGDGSDLAETVESYYISHEYTDAKEYTVTISGVIKELRAAEQKNLIEIEQWWELGLTSLDSGFEQCTNLREIASPTKNSFKDVTSFRWCFSGTGITSIPENLFANCQNATDFNSCFCETGITSIPENLFANCPNATDFSICFVATGITSIPENLFVNCQKVTDFSGCFAYTKITSIPKNLFLNCRDATNFLGCFMYTRITSIPENLFKTCSKASSFSRTFEGCYFLENYLELWKKDYYEEKNENVSELVGGEGCYGNCNSIVNLEDEVPEYWRRDSSVS